MKVKINDFSAGVREDKSDNLKNLAVAKKMQNFALGDGSIKTIKSLGRFYSTTADDKNVLADLRRDYKLAGGKIFFYRRFDFDNNVRDDKIVFFDTNLDGYYINVCKSVMEIVPLNIRFTSTPIATNYRLNGEDVFLMVSKTDNLVVWNGVDAPEIILDAPKIKSMDLHYERLFAVTSGGDNTELKFSDDLDPTNWSESLSDAGFISMVDDRGALIKVISFNDYLYVFREHGITRVYANTALQSAFYVNHLFVSGGRILDGTISLAGDKIVFLATDGFYCFDGADTSKILDNIFSKITITGKEEACYFNGCYYLLCNFDGDKSDSTRCNAIVSIRMKDLVVSVIKGFAPESFVVADYDGKSALIILNSTSGERLLRIGEEEVCIYYVVLSGVFETALYDFGDPTKLKTLRKIKLNMKNDAKGEVEITIFNELGESQAFVFSENINEERLLFSGRSFGFKLETQARDLAILSVELEVN